jgi:Mor family transcriptional regulator
VKVSDLPESLREISRLIGLPATLTLVEWRGGMRLSIPRAVPESHPLARRLGLRAAQVLAAHYNGDPLHVPALSRVLAPLRNRAIRAEFDGGTPVPDLVWRFGLAERRIHEILNRAEAS